PAAFTPEQRQNRGNNWLNALARLKPGVPLRQAQAEMSAIARRLAQAYPDNNAQDNVRLVPLRKSELGDTDHHLTWLTMGLAGFVLLIACANLANLQLVRTRFEGSRTGRSRGARRGPSSADAAIADREPRRLAARRGVGSAVGIMGRCIYRTSYADRQ